MEAFSGVQASSGLQTALQSVLWLAIMHEQPLMEETCCIPAVAL